MGHSDGVLLVDSGNSRLKWALLVRGAMYPGSPLLIRHGVTEADLEHTWGDLAVRPRQVWIANVAGPRIGELLRAWSLSRWQVEPCFVHSRAAGFGVVNGYRCPQALGVDRWLAMIAVRHQFSLPACVVDCGTALTLDVLDESGRHRGGLICPGLELMAGALAQGTSGIDLTGREGASDRRGLADHTAAAVQRGVRQAVLGLIERTFAEQQRALSPLVLILSGGDAAELVRELSVPARLAPDLVLQGLKVVSQW